MRDYESTLKQARTCAKRKYCDIGTNCEYYDAGLCCQGGEKDILNDAADAIEELLAFAYAVAKMAVNAEEDEVSAEVLCRKLYKLGIIEKDGVWWWLPEPPKGVE